MTGVFEGNITLHGYHSPTKNQDLRFLEEMGSMDESCKSSKILRVGWAAFSIECCSLYSVFL